MQAITVVVSNQISKKIGLVVAPPSKGQYRGNEFIIKTKGATKVSYIEELIKLHDAMGIESRKTEINGK